MGDDPRIGAGRGKPLPDIYLLALETVNQQLREQGNKEPQITPEECLVFEDSVPGVEAGRRAGMRVIWCPHQGLLQEYRGREEEVLAGVTGEHKEIDQLDTSKDGMMEVAPWKRRGSGKPGELFDGWGELLATLESFPYEHYGIQIV
jgi:pseudouridine-5'-monophosphatase